MEALKPRAPIAEVTGSGRSRGELKGEQEDKGGTARDPQSNRRRQRYRGQKKQRSSRGD